MTEKEKILKNTISIYWWNFNTKTKDFSGTYKEWFEKKDIFIKPIYKNGLLQGVKANFQFGSCKMKIEYLSGYMDGLNYIIKSTLMYLGDKAMFHDGYGREYKVNWR